MAGSQENATSGLAFANEVAGGRRRQNAVLADQQLLNAICRADLSNQLDNLGVPIPPIAADDEKGAFQRSVGKLFSVVAQGLWVVVDLTFGALRNRQEDTRNKGLAVVRLLEDRDLLAQTRTTSSSNAVSFRDVPSVFRNVRCI